MSCLLLSTGADNLQSMDTHFTFMDVFLSYQKDKAPVKLFEQDEYLISFEISYANSKITFQEELGIDSKMLSIIGSLPTCHSIGRLECVSSS